ncbi:hypothetical protein AB0395_42995 [Streptosporangium sp. NPDC051023]|uniref:hypothetical protein n=1 Tax=Streptosporangium sp. NPDC051023 TaxID=3155410 RepID=UPI00344C00DB
MRVAVVTFDGFNELDSFIASALINRCRADGLEAFITTPTPVVTSMNGVPVTGQRPIEFVSEACGVTVLDAPFHAQGNIATAGGCLASQYLATWVITRALGEDAARAVLNYVAPVGENDETVERGLRAVYEGSGLTLR